MPNFFKTRSPGIWIALLYIILGLPLILFPEISGKIFCWSLSAGAAVYAVSHIWRWRKYRDTEYKNSGDLIVGILFIAVSLFCFIKTTLILSFLPLVLGIILLLDGIFKIPSAVNSYQSKSRAFVSYLAASVIPIALGLLLLLNPFKVTIIVIRVFGISLIAGGISDIVTVIVSSKFDR